MKRLYSSIALYVILALLSAGAAPLLADTDVPRMSKEQLKAKLGDKDFVVLDVRRGKDWKSSEFKIPGAFYVADVDFHEWSGRYAKDKTLVLYCA